MQKIKFTNPNYLLTSIIRYLIAIVLVAGLINTVNAQSVSISGPDRVCPGQQYTFTASSSGVVFPCHYTWYVLRNGVAIAGPSGNASFTYTFDNVLGPVTVRAILSRGIGCVSSTIGNKTVNIAYKTPGPISGPGVICFGQTKSYSTTGLNNTSGDCFFHHEYRWTVPSGWKVEGQSGSYTGSKKTVSIQAPSSGTAQTGQIKVEGYYDDIGRYTPARVFQVRLGKPAVPPVIYGPSFSTAYFVVEYDVAPVPGATSYNWQVPSGWFIQYNGGHYIEVEPSHISGYVRVNSSNACGSSGYQSMYVQIIGGGGPFLTAGQKIKIYPNPSKDYIDLVITKPDEIASQPFSIDNNTTSSQQQGSMMLKLYNLRGELVYSESMSGDYQKINTQNLQNGQYILHVVTDNEIIREKVFIEK